MSEKWRKHLSILHTHKFIIALHVLLSPISKVRALSEAAVRPSVRLSVPYMQGHREFPFWNLKIPPQYGKKFPKIPVTIRYDTVDLRALKSWRHGQLNLAHGPETKNNETNKNQKPSCSEETVQAKVRGGSPGGRSETKGGRICERGRF